MLRYLPLLLGAFLCGAPDTSFAVEAPIRAFLEFSGDCVKTDALLGRNSCDGHVTVLQFSDGYVSFQFKSEANNGDEHNRDFLSFVGSRWGSDQTMKVEPRPGEDQDALGIHQMVFYNPKSKSMEVKPYSGQCVLTYASSTARNASDVKIIRCEYVDAASQDGFIQLSNITYSKVNMAHRFDFFGLPRAAEEGVQNSASDDRLPRPLPKPDSGPSAPEKASPSRIKAENGIDGDLGLPFIHNDSRVRVFEKAGVIAYQEPKRRVAGTISPGDVLFHGAI